MASNPSTFDQEELQAWLMRQPKEVSLVIAARCALRVLPLLEKELRNKSSKNETILHTFRNFCFAMSYYYFGKSAKGEQVVTAIRAAAAGLVAAGRAATPVTDAAYAVAACIAAADDAAAANSAGVAVAAAVSAYATAEYVYPPTSMIAALAFDRRQIDGGRMISQLAWTPLWLIGSVPDGFARDWVVTRNVLFERSGENWDVWTKWYEARIEGAPPEPEVLAAARCTLPEPMWEEGAQVVNTAIRDLVALCDRGGPAAVERRMAEYRAQYPETPDSPDEPDPGRTDVDQPRAWILQYKPADRLTGWITAAKPGAELHWKTGKALPKAMGAGDPVVYWRTVDLEDRGGLAGVGRVISIETDVDDGNHRFPTQVTAFDDAGALPRDEVISEAQIDRKQWQGAVLALKPDETVRLDAYLRRKGWPGLIDEKPRPSDRVEDRVPEAVENHETDYVADRPETDRDLLNRASLAFALAHNINRIWTAQTTTKVTKGWIRKLLDGLHGERLNRQTREPDEAAFIMHIDAPWGGGKTTFANFVARILNPAAHGYDLTDKDKLKGSILGGLPLHDEKYWSPEFAARRWFVVDFNAWQNEHVSPPWWNFYEAIRRQCLRATLFEPGRMGGFGDWAMCRRMFAWCRLQIVELVWRVWTPEVRNASILLAIGILLLYGAYHSAWYNTLEEKLPALLGDILEYAGYAVSGGAGVAFVAAIRSGLKTIIDSAGKSANALSLGEADPVQKFRRHVSWFMSQLDEPVLVIVDDLDRCTPKYVVELVRGLLTIFRSPRIVFLLLGDKDWIETAFAKTNSEMAEVHTESRITFGGRFAEKAIQLSFLLPEADPGTRDAYLTAILPASRQKEPSEFEKGAAAKALTEVQGKAREILREADPAKDPEAAARQTEELIRTASEKAAPPHREAVKAEATRIVNRERMLRAATSRSAEADVSQHGLRPLKDFLPPNPRRIKRIVNMVSAYQASAQSTQGIAQGTDRWKQLVVWVVIMSEYPQVWKTLVTDPVLSGQLLDLIGTSKTGGAVVLPPVSGDAPDVDKALHGRLAALLVTPGLVPLLRGDPFAGPGDAPSPARIDTAASQWLRRLTPID